VLPVAKHIPGHGRTTVDAHFDLPTVIAPRVQLLTEDFAPFRALKDLPMGMTGHLVFTAYDDQHPATQSAMMVNVIRHEIGFHGLLMTDDLNMNALAGDLSTRAAAAIAAGCDLALHCKGDLAEMQMVAAAAGDMNAASIARAYGALSARIVPEPVDIAALQAELSAMMAEPHLTDTNHG
jgi:beta-N-acetylhexosaminidase